MSESAPSTKAHLLIVRPSASCISIISVSCFVFDGQVMSGAKGKKKRKLKEAEAVEVHPDAWERFESTVKTIVPPKKGGAKRQDKQSSSSD